MKGIQKVTAMLEYFRFVIGNTAEACSWCSSRSNGDILRVWFNFSPFVRSEHGVKMTAPLEVCTKDKQHAIVRLLDSEGMKGAAIHWLGYQVWTELFATMKCVRVDRNV
jgi:hypothetical protein